MADDHLVDGRRLMSDSAGHHERVQRAGDAFEGQLSLERQPAGTGDGQARWSGQEDLVERGAAVEVRHYQA
nr:hypothetical protein GCM10020093_023030 [Planobispora longispora]